MHSANSKISRGAAALAFLSLLLLTAAPPALAQTETVLYSFGSQPGDPAGWEGGALVFDKKGNLYGESVVGGLYGWGTVFELSPSGGAWTEKVLHSFQCNGVDGGEPNGNVILDAKSNVYGTTWVGGSTGTCEVGIGGWGTAFEITTAGVENVLYNFGGPPDTGAPDGIVLDKKGNMYGGSTYGGTYSCPGNGGCGTVFEVTKKDKESVLYSFAGSPDGAAAFAKPIFDAEGNLYGTTLTGGNSGCGAAWVTCGIVYELTFSGGKWAEKILYSFLGSPDGGNPGGATFDSLGNIYGATVSGGTYGYGTVFKLSPSGGSWTETVLHNFSGGPTDGANPTIGAALVLDKKGNLYGMTSAGGSSTACSGGCGTVFKLSPSGGSWTETVLHNFSGGPTDGANPTRAGLTLGKKGNLYGTTDKGGTYNQGTVFTVKP